MRLTLDRSQWIDAARDLASQAATPPSTEVAQASLRVLLCILDAVSTDTGAAVEPPPATPIPETATRRKR